MGLVALQHVKSSQTRNRTRVHYIGRQILNHWTTREVHINHFKLHNSAALSAFTLLYNHHHHPSPGLFSSSQTETTH